MSAVFALQTGTTYVKIRAASGSEGSAGSITSACTAIELEQGSSSVCTADATYFVHAYITAGGPPTGSCEIESSAGQSPAGDFTIAYPTPFFRSTTATWSSTRQA